jgi:hypothetical protein
MGQFSNVWSKLGFTIIGEHYRSVWRRRAPDRLRRVAQQTVATPLATPGRLAHRGSDEPERTVNQTGPS